MGILKLMGGSWDADSRLDDQLDYQLVRHSFVAMFWRRPLLDEATQWLRDHGYVVVSADAGDWPDEASAWQALGAALGFHVDAKATVDALGDALSEVVAAPAGPGQQATGLVLVLTGYDALARRDEGLAHSILDTVADRARAALLVGHRLLCLVQTDDPQLDFRPVGGTAVMWNHDEWLDVRRTVE